MLQSNPRWTFLPKEFWEQLPQKTDEELYQVLLQKQDYLPEALVAVHAEIRKRNLSSMRMAEIAAEAVQSQRCAARIAAQDRQQIHSAKWISHLIMTLSLPPLGLLIKFLLDLIMGP